MERAKLLTVEEMEQIAAAQGSSKKKGGEQKEFNEVSLLSIGLNFILFVHFPHLHFNIEVFEFKITNCVGDKVFYEYPLTEEDNKQLHNEKLPFYLVFKLLNIICKGSTCQYE
jgi:hypothetical protein